ncbi:hypothetical protein ACNKHP_20425 [Shigella boydii]
MAREVNRLKAEHTQQRTDWQRTA